MNPTFYNDVEDDDDDCAVSNKDCQNLAEHYIRLFFRSKTDEYGSLIDPDELLTPRNVSLVLNMSICDHMPILYDALGHLPKEKRKGKIPDDVVLALKLFHECSKLSIPKNFATGLVALYIEVCKGCKLEV